MKCIRCGKKMNEKTMECKYCGCKILKLKAVSEPTNKKKGFVKKQYPCPTTTTYVTYED